MLRLPQFDFRILTRNAMAFVLHALCLRISALTGFGVAAWVAANSENRVLQSKVGRQNVR
jgi:hypothetical protein